VRELVEEVADENVEVRVEEVPEEERGCVHNREEAQATHGAAASLQALIGNFSTERVYDNEQAQACNHDKDVLCQVKREGVGVSFVHNFHANISSVKNILPTLNNSTIRIKHTFKELLPHFLGRELS
jgi:hypothetical protein